MTYSPLTDEVLPPRYPKQSSRGGARINGLNVHHWAGTNLSGLTRLVYSDDEASANYLIRNSGSLIGSVPEEFRAWTTSSFAADDDKVTVEIQNSTGGPSWEISDAALETLTRLYADLSQRHDFPADDAHIFGHRDYHPTECPGDYVYSRLPVVARNSHALNEEEDMTFTDKDREMLREIWSGERPKIDMPWDDPATQKAEKYTLRSALMWIAAKVWGWSR